MEGRRLGLHAAQKRPSNLGLCGIRMVKQYGKSVESGANTIIERNFMCTYTGELLP